MKRLAVWLSMMVCIFGSYQLYAVGVGEGAARMSFFLNELLRLARKYDWPSWVGRLIVVVMVVLMVAGVIGVIFDYEKDKKR